MKFLFRRFVFLFSLVFMISSAGFFCLHSCFALGDEALLAINEANGKLRTAYEGVFKAERAGANVSGLLVVLNEAGWFLSRAKLAYSQGDFDSAVVYANECRSMLEGFTDQADALRRSAEAAGRWDFMVNFVGSAVGAVCVLVGGFAVWVFLKRREEVKGEEV